MLVVLDPVCGLGVAVGEGMPMASHGGRDFYFCSAACRERFARKPGRYAPRAPAPVR